MSFFISDNYIISKAKTNIKFEKSMHLQFERIFYSSGDLTV